jgi:FAD:protein FMN transferase
MKKVLIPSGFLFVMFLLLLIFSSKSINHSYISREEPALGTFVKITIEETAGSEIILDEAFKKIRELETILNVHNPTSEISSLNRLKKMRVSDSLLHLIQKSLQISEITGGAFDITVLPLVNLYKQSEETNTSPSEKQIEDTLKNIGWYKIQIKETTAIIPDSLDMGGIAKGYIVDKTVEFLKGKGVKNGLVNAGGDIYCLGKSPGGGKWRIGIQDPFKKNGILKTVFLTDIAVATSGDYERYVSIKGEKYGHIVDPKTGRTVQNSPAGVTVIARDTSTADGLSTAFFVLGVTKSLEISNRLNGIEVMIVDNNGKMYQSKNLSRFTVP